MSQTQNQKVRQIVGINLSVKGLISQDRKNGLVIPKDARASLAVMLIETEPITQSYTAQKDGLIKTHGIPELDKDGKETGNFVVKGDSESFKTFSEENEKLLDTDTPLVIQPIDIKNLGNAQIDVEVFANLLGAGVVKR